LSKELKDKIIAKGYDLEEFTERENTKHLASAV
jgi:hypothetical protein